MLTSSPTFIIITLESFRQATCSFILNSYVPYLQRDRRNLGGERFRVEEIQLFAVELHSVQASLNAVFSIVREEGRTYKELEAFL